MRSPAILVACAALALVAGGCENSGSTPSKKAETAAETLLETCARDEPDAAIGVLTPPLRKAFLRGSSPARACREVLGVGSAGQDDVQLRREFRATRVASVQVEGGFARATLDTPSGLPAKIELEFVRGEWYVGNPPRSRA
jgi:hypothetical protein